MHYVKRREFITLIGAAAAWPLAARAQQFGKMSRVGVLVSLSAPHPFTEAFRSGMRDLGYIEDRNIAIEWRYADAQFSRAVELAAELVRLQVDVIAAYHTPAVKAAMNATRTIPIVMSPAGAPLEMGLVESLAHPGGNVTGLSNMEAELGGKRLDLLREAIPGLARVAVLAAKTDPFTASFVQDLQNGAARLGLQLHPVMVNSPSEFEEAFATMSAAGDQAVIVQPSSLVSNRSSWYPWPTLVRSELVHSTKSFSTAPAAVFARPASKTAQVAAGVRRSRRKGPASAGPS